jgi:enamine deaminase RidA (YjgF/YER057c/UK114 family)
MARIELAANAEEAMDKRQCNPWTWQDAFGFSQAWRVEGAGTLVFVSGQGPISADGAVVAADDFEAQARQTFENLRTVLEQAGASFDDVVKVTTLTRACCASTRTCATSSSPARRPRRRWSRSARWRSRG